ncbi:hypothetical protein GCM10012275_22170 [Longimycelium tulufanense]|uniref:Polysaccharide biosynthesis protein n=1 Tax=Longimycelium tulufanense TaxID=907463 RepID=A0A8J3FTZ6_9PSEU|nr:oligosaccharide flippase family protein [Longimycelium tulufanense]GGM50866.1 hypothetical protein GCM10012275_22170 [Longimycelium tulufanense]
MSTAATLSGRFQRGLWLSLLNTLLSRVGTFAMGVLLARLLVPQDFGVYATALVVQTVLLTFNDFGVASAVVRREGEVRSILPTAWTVAVVGGALAFLASLLAAPTLARLMGSPEGTGVIQLLSSNVLLDGFAAVPGALLTRELQQVRRLVVDLAGTVTTVTLTVVLALAGAGPWSLGIGHVTGTALVVVLLMAVTKELPRFGIDRTCLREVGRYGAAVVATSLVLALGSLAPQAVTGTVLGGTAAGYFYLANNVANWPVSTVSSAVERIALATFSRARDADVDLDRAVAGVTGLVGVAVLPGGAALALLAEPLVRVLYGSDWLPSADALSGLAVGSTVLVLVSLVVHVLVAAGAPLSSVVVQVVWLAALVPGTVVAAWLWGLPGVGWAQGAVALLVGFPVHLWGMRRAGLRVTPLLLGLGRPLLVTAVSVTLLLAVRLLDDPVTELVTGGGITAAIAVGGWLSLRRQVATTLDGTLERG